MVPDLLSILTLPTLVEEGCTWKQPLTLEEIPSQ